MQVAVGKEAPDFGANAYYEGGFTSISSRDHDGIGPRARATIKAKAAAPP